MFLMRISKYMLFLSAILLGSCSVNQQIKKADKKYEIGEYYKASSIYKRAYTRVNVTKEREKKAYVAYRLGDCYRLINDNEKAERAFQNAVRYNCKDSMALLLYADVLRKNKKSKAAVEQYELFLKDHPSNRQASIGRTSALEAVEWEKNPTKYKVEKLTVLESKRSERSPAFPAGETDVIYFASSRENKAVGGKNSNITGIRNNDIFFARRNALGEWDNIEPVEGDINTMEDEGSPSFSPDGKVMYFTRCPYVKGESHGAQICKSVRSGGKWGKAQEVKLSKDSSVTFAHPTVSPDGKYLYFVSDLAGGYGGKDIWRSSIEGDKYGAPVNLGPSINTAGDEMFPYMREDSVLYFSSNGLPGFGGLDIFYAKEVSDGRWAVKSMMYPINSNADDFGISFVKGANRGAFSSNRNEKKGYDKIWSFELPDVVFDITGKVLSTTGEPLGDAIVRIVGTDGTNTKIKTKSDGSFTAPLKRNVEYVMLGNCRGYLNQKETVVTLGLEDSKSFPINFSLASISKPVGLDNIFFEFGKATLTPESSTSLDKLVKLLNDNPNITIEIGAHTDKVGSAEGNLALSGKRAESVVDYLIKAGIEAERLTAKGYGKTQPITVDKALAAKHSFLREGDVLDEEFIDKLPADQQEIANQSNRRTEFRVLKTTYKMY
ncbi:MAG: OmpA family protein [Paludibacteraceae bacterium]|nr:OmpA family protein [Paludibacteraceae bacterium]MBR4838963.1 OmpA family protein [Paludibacteraceae bacterium]